MGPSGRRSVAAVGRMSVQNRGSLLAMGQPREAVTGLKLRHEGLGAGSAPLRRKNHKLTG